MDTKRADFKRLMLAIAIGLSATIAHASTPATTSEAVNRVANRLVEKQIKTGEDAGAWPTQGVLLKGMFTGTMVAGLTEAYWMTCKPSFKTAAELGGQWILNNAPTCNFFYDEAYALTRLSQMACDPQDNIWRTALTDFFVCVRSQPPDPDVGGLAGTEWYISKIKDTMDPAYATFEVAYYAVAAYYIDDPDKTVWRNALINLIETVENVSASPILALGAATWALSLTGPMDSTSAYAGDSSWDGFPTGVATTLAQFSPLLRSYRVPSTYPLAGGHFYWLYIPQNEGDAGWTAPNAYGIMGLAAAMQRNPGLNYREDIDIVWRRTLKAIDTNGDVWFDAVKGPGGSNNATYYFYGGELLQALSAAALPGDINRNDKVNLVDLEALAINWLSLSGCTACSVADLTRDRKVNLADLARLSEGWMLER